MFCCDFQEIVSYFDKQQKFNQQHFHQQHQSQQQRKAIKQVTQYQGLF